MCASFHFDRLSNIKIGVEYLLKFGLSEKYTKFENIFLMVLTNQLIYLVNVKNHEEDFFKLCVLLKKSELYDFFISSKLVLFVKVFFLTNKKFLTSMSLSSTSVLRITS